MKKRPTVGQLAADLNSLPAHTENALVLAKQSDEYYIESLRECVEKHIDIFPNNFFVEVILRNGHIDMAFRNQFNALNTCPAPTFDQTVFRFNKKTLQIEHLWTIPDEKSCYTLLYYRNEVVPEERQLLKYVHDYATGELFRYMKHLNNEELDSMKLKKE